MEGEVKQFLLTGLISDLDHHLGRLDDVLALWKVREARETAWENGQILWRIDVRERETSVTWDVPFRVERVVLDPESKVLRWIND